LTALQASETGHLVVSTMHSERVADTMERYLNLFPADNAKHGVNPSGKPALGRPVPEAG
jgi:twitching motility protein PilT